MQTVEDYLSFLHTKGFKLSEEAQGFIMFGQGYTGASDGIVNAAIEATIKHQLQFDGSYFVALLERLKEEEITDKKRRLLCGSYKRNFTQPALFVLEGNSTKTMPRKIHRHPIIAEIERCSFATRTPVKTQNGLHCENNGYSRWRCMFCADVWMKKQWMLRIGKLEIAQIKGRIRP